MLRNLFHSILLINLARWLSTRLSAPNCQNVKRIKFRHSFWHRFKSDERVRGFGGNKYANIYLYYTTKGLSKGLGADSRLESLLHFSYTPIIGFTIWLFRRSSSFFIPPVFNTGDFLGSGSLVLAGEGLGITWIIILGFLDRGTI